MSALDTGEFCACRFIEGMCEYCKIEQAEYRRRRLDILSLSDNIIMRGGVDGHTLHKAGRGWRGH